MKRFARILLLACVLLLHAGWAFAQRTVSGWVRDDIGEPLAGASVLIKGTTTGAIADQDGIYELTVPGTGEGVTLVFSFMGYEDIEKKLGRSNRVNVVLEPAATSLDEAVVVGYGTQEKASITGAISNITGEDIEETATGDATNALMGRIAGLISMQGSGLPGEDEGQIFIRGQESDNEGGPLVLVDGVERSLAQIPPEEIQSISVLKDASATAVYGMRGANGVILVTTKRGRSGKARVSFSASHSVTGYTRMTPCLDAYNTARLMREGAVSHSIDPSGHGENTWYYGVSEYDNYLYRSGESPFTHPDNNFIDTFTRHGSHSNYSVSVSGGAPTLRYYIALSEFEQNGMFETDVEKIKSKPDLQRLIDLNPAIDDMLQPRGYNSAFAYRRLSFRSNLDIHLTKELEVKLNLSYTIGNSNRPGEGVTSSDGGGIFRMNYNNSPQRFPIINPDGSFGAGLNAWRQNPLVSLCYSGFSRYNNSSLKDNIQFTLNLGKWVYGLVMTGDFSYDAYWSSGWSVSERPDLYAYNSLDGSYERGVAASLPSRSSWTSSVTFNGEGKLALRYSHSFNQKHNLQTLLVGNISSRSSASGGTYAYIPQTYKSLIGRVNYNYENKYLFEVNAGLNGSNRFAKGHRSQLFPATSVGWIFTQEEFMKDFRKILNFGKIRASYGLVGDDGGGSFSYYFLDSYTGGQSYSFGQTWHSRTAGLQEGTKGNPLVSWEVSNKFDLGMNTKWLGSTLEFNWDFFYNRRRRNLNRWAGYTTTSGTSNVPLENIGSTINRGFEIELNYTHTTPSKFTWYVNSNLSYSRNTVVRSGEADQPYAYLLNRGYSIGQQRGYHALGFFSSYEEIAASPTQFGLSNLMPGDIKYADLNGDGVVNYYDTAVIGYARLPRMSGAITLGARWKSFDTEVMLQGAGLSSVLMTGGLAWDNNAGNYFPEHLERWTPETAASATYPRLNYRSLEQNQNYFNSDFWLKSGAYLRLRNARIGYSLPREYARAVKLSSVRVYISAYNLYTWDYLKKVDPESRYFSGDVYPQQRIVTGGIQMSF